MKTRAMRRGMRQTRIWAGRLMLAALLCLDAWLVSRVACDWPRVTTGPSVQAYPVDVASVFGAR